MLSGREKDEDIEKGKKGMKLPNNPFISHKNYNFAYGVVFVFDIVCLFIISLNKNMG